MMILEEDGTITLSISAIRAIARDRRRVILSYARDEPVRKEVRVPLPYSFAVTAFDTHDTENFLDDTEIFGRKMDLCPYGKIYLTYRNKDIARDAFILLQDICDSFD